jgi:plastocyanin
VGDLFFDRPTVSLLAGGTLTWRFDGPTLHNITLANGPRGFSSKTATIKVKGRNK